jgi:hypothetical protein
MLPLLTITLQVNRSAAEYAALGVKEREQTDRRRVQHTSTLLVDIKSQKLKASLKDPTVLRAYKTLEKDGDLGTVFIDLHNHAQVVDSPIYRHHS